MVFHPPYHGDQNVVLDERMLAKVVFQRVNVEEYLVGLLLVALDRDVFHHQVFEVLQLFFHVGVVLFVFANGERGAAAFVQDGLHIREHLPFLIGEVLGQFLLIVRKEFPDDALLLFRAGPDHVLQGGGHFRHHHFRVVRMRLMQVLEDVQQMGGRKGLPGGPIAVEGIYAANEKERFRVYAGLLANLCHGGVPEAEMQAQPGCNAQKGEVRVQQFRHFHGGAHGVSIGACIHTGHKVIKIQEIMKKLPDFTAGKFYNNNKRIYTI